MTGREAAKIIREFSAQQYPYVEYNKRYSLASELTVRRWAAHELANRCARSILDPEDVVMEFIQEMESCLRSYSRTKQEKAYSRFLNALTTGFDILELIDCSSDAIDRYGERRGLI